MASSASLADPTPLEEVFDDREAGDRDPESTAERLEEGRSHVRKDVDRQDPAHPETLRLRRGDEIGIEHVDHPRRCELGGERDGGE